MKWFVRIFCLYLFALSSVHCDGGEDGCDANSGGEPAIFSANRDSPAHDDDCADFCSPFCNCSCCCCATSAHKLATLQIAAPLVEHRQPSSTSKAPFSTEHFLALLRPPIFHLG